MSNRTSCRLLRVSAFSFDARLDDSRAHFFFEKSSNRPIPPGVGLPFLMQATTLSYDDFIGRQACGRILEGTIRKGQTITRVDQNGHPTQHKIVRIEGYHGLKRIEMEEGGVGDIVIISGIPDIMIGDTLCANDHIAQLPPISLAEPTLSIEIMV
jgi:GTP-binding protein